MKDIDNTSYRMAEFDNLCLPLETLHNVSTTGSFRQTKPIKQNTYP